MKRKFLSDFHPKIMVEQKQNISPYLVKLISFSELPESFPISVSKLTFIEFIPARNRYSENYSYQ